MVQFNLLPDVKLDYIKARRMQRLIVTICLIASAVSVFILVVMFSTVNILQKNHLSGVTNEIKTLNSELQKDPDLPKILTIQSQLKSLSGLHAAKPVTSRLFDYLNKVVPANVKVGQLSLDYNMNTINFNGTAASIGNINQFVDTLKFTTYKTEGGTEETKAFSNVVLTSFSKDGDKSSYTINMTIDPAIFNSANKVTLTVPKITTTRSETDKPGALFEAIPKAQQGAQ